MAKVTQEEFDRLMGVFRNTCVPRKYNLSEPKYTPDYGFDTLNPAEMKGVDYWITIQDNATRFPVDVITPGLTPSDGAVTVTQNQNNFTIENNGISAFELTGASISQDGWYIISFQVYSDSKGLVVINETGGVQEEFPVACGNKNFSEPEYDNCDGLVIYPIYMVGTNDFVLGIVAESDSDTLLINNLQIARVAKN
jgi:hypothetical protein